MQQETPTRTHPHAGKRIAMPATKKSSQARYDRVLAKLHAICRKTASLLLTALAATILLAILTANTQDPSANNATRQPPTNLLGKPGAYIADLAIQVLGVTAILLVLPLFAQAWAIWSRQEWPKKKQLLKQLILLPISILLISIPLGMIPPNSFWPAGPGMGGVVGRVFSAMLGRIPGVHTTLIVLTTLPAGLLCLYIALGLSLREWRDLGSAPKKRTARIVRACRNALQRTKTGRPRSNLIEQCKAYAEKIQNRTTKNNPKTTNPEERYRPLPLEIFAKPPSRNKEVAKSELQKNAQLLENTLADFGVSGTIKHIQTGPVVTRYALEPAPGIKTSRVVALADDIARTMCKEAARISVIPGENTIGIELPNDFRETVFLRELLESMQEQDSRTENPQPLLLALGKSIDGKPRDANLAYMPHLLIAGTTGSGKSVAINAMLLSLLFRLPPSMCRLILIDPKMLEFTLYDGIPHLLAPVVTEPKKAIQALKWAVQEMEDRYRRMSKLGVRGLHEYNQKAKEAIASGKPLTRRVETGFDPQTGTPVQEEEEISSEPLPFVVVVIDELADLMMVAGKEVECAIQRLSQMARAAGIHLIVATQRPSVDVITGSIKANFPNRISFQVTSRIDSRTILDEQGAEQLLGRGDLLFMSQGGRVERMHGPFVSGDEIEKAVQWLKRHAPTDYRDIFTTVDADADAESGKQGNATEDLYRQAKTIVLEQKRASTSFLQRRLQIGYNRAANLIERMEEEGFVSKPNVSGKREVLQ